MSGGHYNYAYSQIQRFAEDLTDDLRTLSAEPETVAALAEIARVAYRLERLMHAAEWFMSSDTGEETFMKEYRIHRKELVECLNPNPQT